MVREEFEHILRLDELRKNTRQDVSVLESSALEGDGLQVSIASIERY